MVISPSTSLYLDPAKPVLIVPEGIVLPVVIPAAFLPEHRNLQLHLHVQDDVAQFVGQPQFVVVVGGKLGESHDLAETQWC